MALSHISLVAQTPKMDGEDCIDGTSPSPFPSAGKLCHKTTQTDITKLEQTALKLCTDVILHRKGQSSSNPTPLEKCLRRCVDELLNKHAYLFNGIMSRLELNSETGYVMFESVASELFLESDEITWGRIVTLFAFAVRVVLHCEGDSNLQHVSEQMPHFLARYMGENVADFLKENGGWEGMCQHFPSNDDTEQRVWAGLILTGLGLGLAATFFATHS